MRKAALAAAVLLAIPTAVLAQASTADGQVTKVNAAENKITVRHGPIKSLDMDAMTMVFRVKDPAMTTQVKAGDKIKFEAERVDGQITITKMQKAK